MFTTQTKRAAIVALSSLASLALQPNVWAVTQTTGTGSAVFIVEGAAHFESLSALSGNPYLEGGMSFSRTGLTFDNNGCGFAGCASHSGFAGFSGNYMYGTGTTGYFDMTATSGNVFRGLEFTIGDGYSSSSDVQNVSWQAFNDSILVASGTLTLGHGTVIGFSDANGFDTLRYTSDNGIGFVAPAFDTVHAQFTAPIPEPEIYAMMLTGLGVLGFIARRNKRQIVAA